MGYDLHQEILVAGAPHNRDPCHRRLRQRLTPYEPSSRPRANQLGVFKLLWLNLKYCYSKTMSKGRGLFLKVALTSFAILLPLVALADGSIDVAPPAFSIGDGYQLEVITQENAGAKFKTDLKITFQRPTRLIGLKLIDKYRLEYLQYPDRDYPTNPNDPKLAKYIDANRCVTDPKWSPVVDEDGSLEELNDYRFFGKRQEMYIFKALDPQKGFVTRPTYFRLVALEGADTSGNEIKAPLPLVCSGFPVMPLRSNDEIIQIQFTTVDNATKKEVPSKVTIDGKSPTTFGFPGDTTPLSFRAVPRDNSSHNLVFTPTDTSYRPNTYTLVFDGPHALTVPLIKVGSTDIIGPVEDNTSGDSPTGGQERGNGVDTEKEGCGKFIAFGTFNPSGWILCELHGLGSSLADLLTRIVDNIPLNTWPYIRDTNGVIVLWTISLGLIDLIVVAGLLVAAFANIFRFRIDTYGIKQILPGLIIGIILANLSFFIMRLFLELGTIFTQAIGELVGSYIGADIGNRGAASFLANQIWTELSNSLFSLPTELTKIGLVSGGVREAIAVGVNTSAVPGAVFLSIVALMLSTVPLILLLALMVVYYIRHYILMVLFMVSPIAFFSLGFPPLKALVWQKWWGTFWKWLLMLPVSSVLLGFAIIFLHFANPINASAVKVDIDFGRYALINVVSFAIIFLAYRLPFMWGSVFGVGVLPKWENLGAQTTRFMGERARRMTNSVFDTSAGAIGGAIARRRAQRDNFELINATGGPPGSAAYRQLVTEGARLGMRRKKRIGETITAFQGRVNTARLDSEGANLRLPRIAGETDSAYLARINARRFELAQESATTTGSRSATRYNPLYNLQSLPEGFRLREEARLKGETTRVRGTEGFKQLAGREGAYRFYFADNRELINGIESLPQAVARLNQINNRRIDPRDLEELRGMSPSAIAADSRFNILDAEDLANTTLLVGKIQNLARSRSATARSPFREVYMSQGTGWQFGDDFDPGLFEQYRSRTRRSPYAGLDPDEILLNPKTGAKSPLANQQQAFMAMAQATQSQEMPIETMDKMLRTIRRRMDRLDRSSGRKSIGYQDFANLGVSRQQYQAVRPQMSEYIGQRKQFTEAVDQGNLVGNDRRDELGSSREIAKQIASTQGSNVDAIRQELNTFRTTLNQPQVDSAGLGQIRASLEKIHPSIGITAQIEQDPIELQGALKKAVKQSWDATSILNESAMKHAVGQGENIDDALNQTLRVRQIKEHTTQELARIVDNVGDADPATIRTNPDVINHIAPSIHSLIEYHEPIQDQMEGLGAAAQQEVINRTASEFAAQIAEHAKTLGSDTNILQSVSSDEDQRERFSHQLDEIIQAQIAAIKSGTAAATSAGTVVTPSAPAPQPEAPAVEPTPTVQPTAEQQTPPPPPEPPPNLP